MLCGAVGLALSLPLLGCGNFFQSSTSSGTSTTSTTSTTTNNSGDYAYVSNSSAGSTYLSEYDVAGGKLASLGTLSLGFQPSALAVSPNNSFVYVATLPGATTPGIYLYTIGSTGTLTVANGGAVLATDTVASMAISPDGNWLYTLNSDGLTMAEYAVNTTTGLLTLEGDLTLPETTCNLTAVTPVSQTCTVAVAASGDYLIASLGLVGDVVFPYSSASGVNASGLAEIPSGYSTTNATGDFSVAMDKGNYAYIARTNGLAVYSIGSTNTSVGTVTYTSGTTPRGVTLSTDYTHVFTANEGANTISSFGIASDGNLTAATGSPFAAPTAVSALGVDNTGTYMVAVGYDSSTGVTLYSMASGVLTKVDATGSGTSTQYPALVAMTH